MELTYYKDKRILNRLIISFFFLAVVILFNNLLARNISSQNSPATANQLHIIICGGIINVLLLICMIPDFIHLYKQLSLYHKIKKKGIKDTITDIRVIDVRSVQADGLFRIEGIKESDGSRYLSDLLCEESEVCDVSKLILYTLDDNSILCKEK